jgi:aspartate kinase
MKVFKFGGASIENIERVKRVAEIIKEHSTSKLLVVISAMGKTTNALEKIVNAFFENNLADAKSLFQDLEETHNAFALALVENKEHVIFDKLKDLYTEIDWMLADKPVRSYDYYYDQIVSIGELLSTSILSAYFNHIELKNEWVDIRDVMRTDDTYRDAVIDWDYTKNAAVNTFAPLFEKNNIIVTQGFIGCTDENTSVTLGREGSDYTAAVLANILDAESVTIWKDVPSLLNADPKLFENTIPISVITYHEVIEMSYYGAQVIHPKTIKPLHNKNIPLYVKCFLDSKLPGTTIINTEEHIDYPPIFVLKKDQVLLSVTTKDYSFVTEDNLSQLYSIFHDLKIKVNLIQNAAISFVACIDNHPEKLSNLLKKLEHYFDIKRNENLTLLTIRHYTNDSIAEQTQDKIILLEQRTRSTIQMVVK